nr:stomatin-like protein 2, mitochondrial [Tanacetum cinerariifolium]
GFYTIKEAERGVVTHFGKFSHLVEPGLNWRPVFINNVQAVNVETVRELATSGIMLTSDENVVRVEMNVQYKITNPSNYLFSVAYPDDSLRQATDSALRGVIGRSTMDRILTEGRTLVRHDTQKEIEETIRPYHMGLTVLDVNFQTARPPEEVKSAFDDAIAARENREQYVREAESYANEVQPKAHGKAQRERGIVLQFGKVLKNNNQKALVYNPGLHFKIPFLETVKMLDARIHTMDNQADRFVTKEKKDLIVDSYIKWRINDFSRYYLATGNGDIFQAEVLLKRKFSDRLRSEIGCLNVKEIVTDSRGRLTLDGTVNSKNLSEINVNSMNALGIEVVDVRIKQINLPVEVSEAIYNRMRAEREAVARSQRSQGQEKAEKLRAMADYKVSMILAEARKNALILKDIAREKKLGANAIGTTGRGIGPAYEDKIARRSIRV